MTATSHFSKIYISWCVIFPIDSSYYKNEGFKLHLHKLTYNVNGISHYSLLFFSLRIFLKEIENCIENPELLARCFLKRVSISLFRFEWISMVLSYSTYIFTSIFSVCLLLWMRENPLSRYSQIKPLLPSIYSDIWPFTWFTDRKRSVTSVL